MTSAVQILLAIGLATALINLALERGRPRPGEFDDIAALHRAERARAAMRRAATRSTP